jgi:FkbM family methyltransferase
MIKLNTKLLFYQLLRSLKPATVLDVGSLDGTHALRFHKLAPGARVVAFEANPHNVALLRQNADFVQAGIELVPKAVSNHDGQLTFFVEETSAEESWRKGTSSTRRRIETSLGATPTEVEALRLDSFVGQRSDLKAPIAMWIDVEGASYEALEGIEGIRARVLLLHVEVETREHWAGQHLKPDVEALLARLGFACVARGPLDAQHDLVCVRSDALGEVAWRVRELVARTWLLTQAQRYLGSSCFRSIGNAYLKRTQKHG